MQDPAAGPAARGRRWVGPVALAALAGLAVVAYFAIGLWLRSKGVDTFGNRLRLVAALLAVLVVAVLAWARSRRPAPPA